jgi:hypothetical protein
LNAASKLLERGRVLVSLAFALNLTLDHALAQIKVFLGGDGQVKLSKRRLHGPVVYDDFLGLWCWALALASFACLGVDAEGSATEFVLDLVKRQGLLSTRVRHCDLGSRVAGSYLRMVVKSIGYGLQIAQINIRQ